MRPITNLLGKRFGKLTVTKLHSKGHDTKWECLCDCGGVTVGLSVNLIGGRKTSCGCIPKGKKRKYANGKPDGYNSWAAMIQRCYNPKHIQFHLWGGRGLTVCERWKDFNNFIADMGPRPGKGWSIERKNNDLGYSPQNCCWATASQQARNRRKWSKKGQTTHANNG